MSDKVFTVGVIGAGTMGQGIAQLALQAGHSVVLIDKSEVQLQKAKTLLDALFTRFVSQSKISSQDKVNWFSSLTLSKNSQTLTDAKLVIEAIVEDINVKQDIFIELESIVSHEAILATNTSSLSVTTIASCLQTPERFIGLHFFNPPGIMPLVEVIEALQTLPKTTQFCIELMQRWGKAPVRCKDTPGFIVNRVARPFYVESFRLVEEQIVTPTQLDTSIRNAGFKMGPCELTDFIGQDINYAVSCSLFNSLFYPPHLRPSYVQGSLVEAGFLGRKTGKGFYDYRDSKENDQQDLRVDTGKVITFKEYGAHPWVAEQIQNIREHASETTLATIQIEKHPKSLIGILDNNVHLYASDGRLAEDWEAELNVPVILTDIKHPEIQNATLAIALGPKAKEAMSDHIPMPLGTIKWFIIEDSPGLINLRVISMIINEATICATCGIATPEDIDSALKGGVNYPLGAFEWLSYIGVDLVVNTLSALRQLYGSACYTVPRLLLSQLTQEVANDSQ